MMLAATAAFADIQPADLWPVPPAPNGANLAEFPAPMMNWALRVDANINKTKGRRFQLIFDGDNVVDNWQSNPLTRQIWDTRYAPLRAYNFGITFDRTEHLLWRLKEGQAVDSDPKLIVLMIGRNNLGRDTSDQLADGIGAVLRTYLTQCPNARILLMGILPQGPTSQDAARLKIADVNRQIAVFENDRVHIIDLTAKYVAADGTLNPYLINLAGDLTPPGYQLWAEAMAPEIEKTFPAAPHPPVFPPPPAPSASASTGTSAPATSSAPASSAQSSTAK